ncbi:hypothetical protein BC332_25617 [Capsicum chinense]|nr:hypothetical protein BC332_25617 [Capsicum chinense]
MSNGIDIVIKKLVGRGTGHHDHGFSAEIQTLGRIGHRNIVQLLGFVSNKDTNLLLYEYMSNGSLGEMLHGAKGAHLKWKTRKVTLIEAICLVGKKLKEANIKDTAIRSEKENLVKLIEQEHPPVAPPAPPSREIKQFTVEHHIVEEQQTKDDQLVQHQVQMTVSATPTTTKYSEAQAEGHSTRKTRCRIQMHKVHGRQEKIDPKILAVLSNPSPTRSTATLSATGETVKTVKVPSDCPSDHCLCLEEMR